MTDKTDVIRGEFEAWAIPQGFRMHVRDVKGAIRFGQYCDDTTQSAWEAYQAALQSPAVRELVETACNAEKIIRNCVNAGQVNAGYLQHANDLDKALANFTSIKGDEA